MIYLNDFKRRWCIFQQIKGMQRSRQVCGRGTICIRKWLSVDLFCQNGIYKGNMVKVSKFVHPKKSFRNGSMFW